MGNRSFCPNCDAVPRPSDRFCMACGARVEQRPPHVALMLLAYLACAPLAWGIAVVMIGLGGDDPSHPHTSAELDAGFRMGTGVAIVVAVMGAVVLLVAPARRRLGIRSVVHVLFVDCAVAAGMFAGFFVGLG
jgi:hypothetical protein